MRLYDFRSRRAKKAVVFRGLRSTHHSVRRHSVACASVVSAASAAKRSTHVLHCLEFPLTASPYLALHMEKSVIGFWSLHRLFWHVHMRAPVNNVRPFSSENNFILLWSVRLSCTRAWACETRYRMATKRVSWRKS